MARILAIDYGTKRCGIAVSDPLQIIASPLTTIDEKELIPFLKAYLTKESVETIVLGLPLDDCNLATHATQAVYDLEQKLRKLFPNLSIKMMNERYTSKIAKQSIQSLHLPKKKREKKTNVDKVAAALILTDFLSLSKV